MKNDISKMIIKRFFMAIYFLKAEKVINKTEFCNKYGIDRRNLYKLEKSTRTAIELSWLYFLCVDFNISAKWLLTGIGEISEKKINNVQ